MREWLALHPDWSRWRFSRELARLWEWRTAHGQLKDLAARTLLLKLEQRGWIALPARRGASPNRMRHKRTMAATAQLDKVMSGVLGSLGYWGQIETTDISDPGPVA